MPFEETAGWGSVENSLHWIGSQFFNNHISFNIRILLICQKRVFIKRAWFWRLRKSQAKQKATDAHNLRANTTKQSEKGDKKGVQIIGNMCGNVWECVWTVNKFCFSVIGVCSSGWCVSCHQLNVFSLLSFGLLWHRKMPDENDMKIYFLPFLLRLEEFISYAFSAYV